MLAPELVVYLQNQGGTLIRKSMRKLTRKFRSQVTEEDLFQEIVVRLLPQLKRFDPTRGTRDAWFRVAILNCLKSIDRDRRALKRFSPGLVSFEELCVPDVEGGEAGSGGIAMRSDRRLDRGRIDEDELVELRLDIAEILPKVKPKLRRLAKLLMQFNPAEIALLTGVSRSSIYHGMSRLRTEYPSLRKLRNH